ncbi:MAG: Hpt domain-containing protein [Magnetococcales bacterium]|nr:Hpt domain-containing protein [Magnetococcales bacterium]
MGELERITVMVDQDLEDILPGYLKNRHKDLVAIPKALKEGDFNLIRTLGHRMKGSGSGYGFARISEIGENLEEAAKNSESERVATLNSELELYLDSVDIVFEPRFGS